MILELDCGNTLIKWRAIDRDGNKLLDGASVDVDEMLAPITAVLRHEAVRFVRIVSVRSEEETDRLVRALSDSFTAPVMVAGSAPELVGVVNGYEDYARLGLDRWLAMVAAKRHSSRAVLVLDLGTAITSDFVSADGRHLGGFICPGLPMMRNQLRTLTRRIRYDDGEAVAAQTLATPGRNTAEAVERGCLHMVRGFVEDQVTLAESQLGDFDVYLTGGDAAFVSGVLPQAIHRPDLVFEGLAYACPYVGG